MRRRLYLAALVAAVTLGAILSTFGKVSAGTAFFGGILLGISVERYEQRRGK